MVWMSFVGDHSLFIAVGGGGGGGELKNIKGLQEG